MSVIINHKTNFTSGAISTDVLGRTDLKAYDNGALQLQNIFIDSIGGVFRRPGFRFVSAVSGAQKLIPFTFNTEQTYLLVMGHENIKVYKDEVLKATITTPWTSADIPFISWTQSADVLLIVHPNYPPKQITRSSDTVWTIANWKFDTAATGRLLEPVGRFVDDSVQMSSSALTGTTTLTASAAVFKAAHVGSHIYMAAGDVKITAVTDSTHATGTVCATLNNVGPVTDWSESAFSAARGYPQTVTFYQGRLVIGGSRDLPNKLWFSKSFYIMNFDLGTGLDDNAIAFSILSDQVNAIRGMVSGRHLQIFTSGSEWMVSGDPLTPQSIQLKRQTRIGSPLYATVQPIDVSGATIFVSALGTDIREFLFQDLEQAYQAKDLSLLSHHLIKQPVDLSYDDMRRLVYIVMADGTMATLTNYRTEEVLAWSQQVTQGAFKAVAVLGKDVYVLVERDGTRTLEVLDEETHTDCAILGADSQEHTTWSGVQILNGKKAKIIADDVIQQDQEISGNTVTVPACKRIEVGLGFTHIIVPLPPVTLSSVGTLPLSAVRLIKVSFRVVDTYALQADVGNGLFEYIVPEISDQFVFDAPPQAQTKDICIRALGWCRNGITPLWQVRSDVPRPCKIVSISCEMKVSE
ncbi:MAG: hypothetical protein ILP11_00855 [Alphaproteobacteria bacterium]|nr:hypothetical protein [Alphaproteobacteria bacterium]